LRAQKWRTEVRRYKGEVKDAQLKLAATNSRTTAKSKEPAGRRRYDVNRSLSDKHLRAGI
jgi:hypothetical protein